MCQNIDGQSAQYTIDVPAELASLQLPGGYFSACQDSWQILLAFISPKMVGVAHAEMRQSPELQSRKP